MNEICEYPPCRIHSLRYLEIHQGGKWWRHRYMLYLFGPWLMTLGWITSSSIWKCAPIGNHVLVLQQVLDHCKSGCDRDLLHLTTNQKWWTSHQMAPMMKTKKWKEYKAEILYLLHRNIPQLHLSKWKRMTCAGSTPFSLRTPP